MWNQTRSNRLISEREQIKEHLLHMQRLRSVKPQVDMRKPPKPAHLAHNHKKELKKMERLSEIQYENRILLRKMLQIDLKPKAGIAGNTEGVSRVQSLRHHKNKLSKQTSKSTKNLAAQTSTQSNPALALNSSKSLNRANRIRSLAKIIDENKILLKKLQDAKSSYSNTQWKQDYLRSQQYARMIRDGGDRYCKNPYFLHSITTSNGPTNALTEVGSVQSGMGGRQRASFHGAYSNMPPSEMKTVNEYGSRRKKRRTLDSRNSESAFGGRYGPQQ